MSKTRSKSAASSSNGQSSALPAMELQPEHFINRELSWLEFNLRVLEEALDETTPLLERLKFLAIFSSNLDEFFMVRVAGLREQAFQDGAPQDVNADGLRAIDQLKQIRRRNQDLVRRQYRCLNEQVLPQLAEQGIRIVKYAPRELLRRTLELINEQTRQALKERPARIYAKLNSVVDPQIIAALYRASQAGVPIDLLVRGICCLRPGIKGISENIRVRSIVDRFLEHSRIFVFGPDESAKIFLSSADWMPRSFHRRVEVMFPIEAAPLRKRVLQQIMTAYSADNVKARELRSDGSYVRVPVEKGAESYRCQQRLQSMPESQKDDEAPSEQRSKNGRKSGRAKSRWG